MEIVSGVVAVSAITAITSLVSASNESKLKACVDSYTAIGDEDSYREHIFTKCMKFNYPEVFAKSYEKFLKSENALKESE